MQPLPLLFRQSLRTGAGFAKSSAHNRIPATALSLKLSPPQSPFRKFGPAICPQCQFRAQTRAYSAYGDPGKPEKDSEIGSSLENHQNRSPTHSEKSEQAPAVGDHIAPQPSHTSKHGVDESTVGARSNKAAATKDNGRRLPSHWENRRSELWKQFSQLMDNVQSNVFIANRHLNDLTGYSAIEKLKQEILAQGTHSSGLPIPT